MPRPTQDLNEIAAVVKGIVILSKDQAEVGVSVYQDLEKLEEEITSSYAPILESAEETVKRVREVRDGYLAVTKAAKLRLKGLLLAFAKKFGKVTGIQLRRSHELRVVDPTLIPREYWVLDEGTLRKKAKAEKDKFCVPGCEAVVSESLAVSKQG